jgi:transcriptional regulator GlxA family with amidase domain
MNKLQNDGTLSVQAVAWACDYRSMGLFSADFKRRFGLPPHRCAAGDVKEQASR